MPRALLVPACAVQKPRSKHSLKNPEYLIKQTQIDDFYASMTAYSNWMLQVR